MSVSREPGPESASSGSTCIFCRQESTPPYREEHIISESLGCPDSLVLRNGEVCFRCNQHLGRVDGKLVEALRPLTVLGYRIRTKKGKWPRAELGNGVMERTDSGPHITLREYVEGGLQLEVQGPADAPTGVRVRFTIRNDERVARGLHKIAIEAVALLAGRAVALRPSNDPARDYAACKCNSFRPVLLLRQPGVTGDHRHGAITIGNHSIHGQFVLIWLFGYCYGVALEGPADTARRLGECLNALAGEQIAAYFDQRGVMQLP